MSRVVLDTAVVVVDLEDDDDDDNDKEESTDEGNAMVFVAFLFVCVYY